MDDDLLLSAVEINFTKIGSKKNTLFDGIIAAVAKKYDADAIF